MTANAPVISVRDLVVGFGDVTVLDHASLDVFDGEILGFVGGSGAGKSVLMRTIIGLIPKRNGTIEVLGTDLGALGERERRSIERRWGVLFQQGALFSSLTVLQNVQFPIREYLDLSPRLLEEIALAKLEMVGLNADVRGKYPAELSGGMVKRVALARALALDPDIVFLDEPTSGLDPIGAAEFDELISTACTRSATASRCCPRAALSLRDRSKPCSHRSIRGSNRTSAANGGGSSNTRTAQREESWRPRPTTS
jgi:phospholipid/cholesterol/gamma-HCH transport system ATP-binding protein